jgi:hypothetical protein
MEKTVKIAALMTAPRYENTYARNYIERALHELGIPLTVSGGVFYGQCMQMMLEQLTATDQVDYAVTVDFDSLFSAKQLQRLINWISQRDDIDAITGLQVRRGKKSMLGTVPDGELNENGEKQIIWDGNPVKGSTAHFGLTVIDVRKLANVPKPWFWCRPDADGKWTDAKIDDDIWFWNKFREAGRRVWVDIDCRIGHMEEMIAIYDENLQPQHIYPEQWRQQYLERKEQKA